jgi:hypothetical protein
MPRGYFSPRENPQAGEFMYVFGGQDGGYQRGLRSGVDHHTSDAGMRAWT